MTYMPLHHKYRPQCFSQLVGQDAIATTLSHALLQNRIAPAYLFTGARGTGKTSSARIFAKSLNCISVNAPTDKPCGHCQTCQEITRGNALDVIEIDAASNAGVEKIREVIERAQFAPVHCRYKVYILDECLTGDSLVQTSEGLYRIDDPALEGKQVLSYNEKSNTWEYKKVLRWLDQGNRQVYTIKTSNRTIRCTGNHLIRIETGWTPARNVKEGAKILSPVPVDAAKNWSFLNGSSKKGKGWLAFNFIQKGTPKQKTSSLLSGSQDWDTQPMYTPIKPITTLHSERRKAESGLKITSNFKFLQWDTSLEEVKSVHLDGIEKVYDIEVEDNHNFIANNLLVHNCHSLSAAAFNALLKTLEEPPESVVFILATTDPQRLLPTIISRCQRYNFQRIAIDEMIPHLSMIAERERIAIDQAALTLIAQLSQGGLRDAQSLLDQLSLLTGQINADFVYQLAGAIPEQRLLNLLNAIVDQEADIALTQTSTLLREGKDALRMLQELSKMLRDCAIALRYPQRSDLADVTPETWRTFCGWVEQAAQIHQIQVAFRQAEPQIRQSKTPQLWLECLILEVTSGG